MNESLYSLQAISHKDVLTTLLQITIDYKDGLETKLPEITIYTVGSFVFTGYLIDYDQGLNTISMVSYKNSAADAIYIEVGSVVSIRISEVEKSLPKLSLKNRIKASSSRPSNLDIKRQLKYFSTKMAKILDKEVALEADPKSFTTAKEALTLIEQLKELKLSAFRIKDEELVLKAFNEQIDTIKITNAKKSNIDIKDKTLKIHLPAIEGETGVIRTRQFFKALIDKL